MFFFSQEEMVRDPPLAAWGARTQARPGDFWFFPACSLSSLQAIPSLGNQDSRTHASLTDVSQGPLGSLLITVVRFRANVTVVQTHPETREGALGSTCDTRV